jgi:hypothetical protein
MQAIRTADNIGDGMYADVIWLSGVLPLLRRGLHAEMQT